MRLTPWGRASSSTRPHHRYSTDPQVVINVTGRLVVAVGMTLPDNHDDCRAFAESGPPRLSRGLPHGRRTGRRCGPATPTAMASTRSCPVSPASTTSHWSDEPSLGWVPRSDQRQVHQVDLLAASPCEAPNVPHRGSRRQRSLWCCRRRPLLLLGRLAPWPASADRVRFLAAQGGHQPAEAARAQTGERACPGRL